MSTKPYRDVILHAVPMHFSAQKGELLKKTQGWT